jgi:hypothetical protein
MPEPYDADEHPIIAADREQDWYFTFGSNHVHPDTGQRLMNAYVKVFGTEASARLVIGACFGNAWAFQYDSAEAAGVEKYNLFEVELPKVGCR